MFSRFPFLVLIFSRNHFSRLYYFKIAFLFNNWNIRYDLYFHKRSKYNIRYFYLLTYIYPKNFTPPFFYPSLHRSKIFYLLNINNKYNMVVEVQGMDGGSDGCANANSNCFRFGCHQLKIQYIHIENSRSKTVGSTAFINIFYSRINGRRRTRPTSIRMVSR